MKMSWEGESNGYPANDVGFQFKVESDPEPAQTDSQPSPATFDGLETDMDSSNVVTGVEPVRRKKPKKHFIWHLVRAVGGSVMCSVCDKRIGSPSVTNLSSHLRRRHPLEYEKAKSRHEARTLSFLPGPSDGASDFRYLAATAAMSASDWNPFGDPSESPSSLLVGQPDRTVSPVASPEQCGGSAVVVTLPERVVPTATVQVRSAVPVAIPPENSSPAATVRKPVPILPGPAPTTVRIRAMPVVPRERSDVQSLPSSTLSSTLPQVPSERLAVRAVGFDRALIEKRSERSGIIVQIGPMSSSRLEEANFYKVGDRILLPESGGVKVDAYNKEYIVVKITEIDGIV